MLSIATTAASQATSVLSSVASRLLSSSAPTSTTLPPERPYDGPDLLSSLSHDLHAHVFTFLSLRALFAVSRVSSAFSALPSHPTCDELYRQQLFDPFHAALCSDRSAGETWRDYVSRVVDVERRLVSGGEDGVLYDVGGCDEDHPHRGSRMYIGAQHFHAANYDSNAQLFWNFDETDDTPFPVPGLLVLRNVCWLQVECLVRLPSPPPGHTPYRYRLFWRLGVSERSNLGGPTFSVAPVEEDAAFATAASRVVYNDQLRRLIDQPYTHIPGVGDEQPPTLIPQPDRGRRGGEDRGAAASESEAQSSRDVDGGQAALGSTEAACADGGAARTHPTGASDERAAHRRGRSESQGDHSRRGGTNRGQRGEARDRGGGTEDSCGRAWPGLW